MEQTTIIITLRGEIADKLRNAQADKPARIDWSGFSNTLADEHK